VIVSANRFNKTPINTVIVVFLTANAARGEDPGNIWLDRHQTGLQRDSVANITQFGTVDKRILSERIGRVPDDLMAKIDDGLRLVLGL
jgi:mRNA interferase MazF